MSESWTIRTQIAGDTRLENLTAAMSFFDSVCEPDSRKGECSSYLSEADVDGIWVLEEEE